MLLIVSVFDEHGLGGLSFTIALSCTVQSFVLGSGYILIFLLWFDLLSLV